MLGVIGDIVEDVASITQNTLRDVFEKVVDAFKKKQRYIMGFGPVDVPPHSKKMLYEKAPTFFKELTIVSTGDVSGVYLHQVKVNDKPVLFGRYSLANYARIPLRNANRAVCNATIPISVHVYNDSDKTVRVSFSIIGNRYIQES